MPISKTDDVRLTMGGEPTFVSVDDLEVAGMEYRRRRPDQARARRRSDPQAARAFRARRPAALRAGQMVSRRKPAALGVRAVLAQGRRADLEECRPDRQHRESAQGRDRRRRTLRRRHRAKARPRRRLRAAGVRGSRALAAEGSRAARQCRSDRFQTVRSGRALADGAGVRSGPQHAEGLCAADPALERDREPHPGAGAASAGSCGAAICS